MKIFKHFATVVKHKYYVFIYSCKLGIPWLGFLHDFSKFTPTEFFRSAKYYDGTHSPTIEERKAEGFSQICIRHTGRNKHHWEYWTDFTRNNIIVARIPYKRSLEYIADICSASKVYHKKDFTFDVVYDYFYNHQKDYLMHPATKEFILTCVKIIKDEGFKGINKRRTKKLYEELKVKYPNVILLDIHDLNFSKLDF